MTPRTLKASLNRDQAVYTTWLTFPAPIIAEILGHEGWEGLVLDLQHGAIGFEDALLLLQAMASTPAVPLARIPWLEPGTVMKMLDAGVQGVIAPMIDTEEQAAALVSACLYPPAGRRSWGPFRPSITEGSAYAERANDRVLPIAQIETGEAVRNLDAILAVEGLAAVYVGPNDLAWSLGHAPGSDREEPELLEIILDVPRKAREHGVQAGIHTRSPAYARRMVEAGYRLITIGSDGHHLRAGSRTLRGALGLDGS